MSNIFSERTPPLGVPARESAPVDRSPEVYRSIEDVEITLTAELGRRLISVQELLRLSLDDVLVLSRPAGENVDVLAGDVFIGSAEILAVDDNLSIRIAELFCQPDKSQGQILKPARNGY